MATPKYHQCLKEAVKENPKLFNSFEKISKSYLADKMKHQEEFNKIGKQAMQILRKWEQILCRQTEKGSNSVFSARLAERYWEEVRKKYPMIDFVGVKVVSAKKTA